MAGEGGGFDAANVAGARSLARIVYVATLAVFLALLALALFPPQFRFAIQPSAIEADAGAAYVAKTPRPHGLLAFLSLEADIPGSPHASDLAILEDGRPLPSPHASREDLTASGAGRFVHWRGHVHFSATDNSDPRTNGRSYEGRSPLRAPPLLKIFALLLSLAAVWCYLRARPRYQALLRPWATAALWPFHIPLNPARRAALCVLALIAGAAFMSLIWLNGWSTMTSLAGYLPITDGKGHHECARQLIDFGENAAWCHRRPIYSVFLAGLYVAVGRNLALLHIAQASIVLMASLVFAREASRWVGLGGAAALLLALLLFCWKWIFGQTMSEALGLTVGLLGQAVLLRAAETRSINAVALGIFLVSVALNARPGAVLTLGVLVLWASALRWREWSAMVKNGAVATAAVIGGFAAHSLCMLVVHGDLTASYGNFSLTVYGLSVGQIWSSTLADHPELATDDARTYSEIYRLAFVNFAAHPEVMLRGLWDNFQLYVTTLWNGWLPVRNLAGVVLLYFGSFGGMAVYALKSRRALLVLAFIAGDAASSLLIARDGELRVWAATIAAAQMLPFVIVLVAAGRWYAQNVLAAASPPTPAGSNFAPRSAIALAGAIAFLMALTATGAVRLSGLRQVAARPACPVRLTPYVFTLGSSGNMLTVDDAPTGPTLPPGRLNHHDLNSGVSDTSWFRRSTVALPSIHIIQADQALTGGPPVVALYAPAAMHLPEGEPLAVCVDASQQIDVGGAPYDRIVTAAPLR